MWLIPFYSLLSYLRQIPAFTQVLGCSWLWPKVDRRHVSLEWLTRGASRCLHYCESNSLSVFFSHWLTLLFYFSVSLAFSCLTFLTSIWSQGVVFTWLIKTIGISALITWTSIGVISIRFRKACKAQGLSPSDLPYQQPFYPLLPIGVIALGVVMSIGLGYSSVLQNPFDFRVSTLLYGFKRTIFLKLTSCI